VTEFSDIASSGQSVIAPPKLEAFAGRLKLVEGTTSMTFVTAERALNEFQFPGNTAAFDELLQILKSQKLLGFIGSGVSIPLMPSWNGVLCELLTTARSQGLVNADDEAELRSQIKTDPLMAADFLEEAFTSTVFRSLLSTKFRTGNKTFTEAHELIVRCNLCGIITLNYDQCIEAAHVSVKGSLPASTNQENQFEIARWRQGSVFDESNTPILHLHGVNTDPASIIFTGNDYNRFYVTGDGADFVDRVWLTKQLLVIGFGFADPFLTFIAQKALRSAFSGARHFALIGVDGSKTVTPMMRKQFITKYRLRPIFYRVTYETDSSGSSTSSHSGLNDILKHICDSIKSSIENNIEAGAPADIAIDDGVVLPNLIEGGSEQNFDRYLFRSPTGNTLYVEPRLMDRPQHGVADDQKNSNPIELDQIIASPHSYLIIARSECGASTLCQRIKDEFQSRPNSRVFLRDAQNLPSYRRKLEKEFDLNVRKSGENRVLILDNYAPHRDERLIREIQGLEFFSKYIICMNSSSSDLRNISVDSLPIKCISAYLWYIDRSDIRILARLLFESNDDSYISSIVDKVYADLMALCIPLTPPNVIMYLLIIFREGEFCPLNRVQIVDKYISSLLQGHGDVYTSTFNAKNKMDVISAFSYHLNCADAGVFSENDWCKFCEKYKSTQLIHFDDRKLFNELINSRIFIQFGDCIVFKYRFFFCFFLGRHVSFRSALMKGFLEQEQYLRVRGTVEVVSGLSADNTVLMMELTAKLEHLLDDFSNTYVPDTFDPFADLRWSTSEKEEGVMWAKVQQRIEDGPHSQAEIDIIKSSLVAERMTVSQTVAFEKFDKVERRLFAFHFAVEEALKNSDELDGELKKRAARAVLRAYFKLFQVTILLAPILVSVKFYDWNGILFINTLKSEDAKSNDKALSDMIIAFLDGILLRAATEFGSRRLGVVFKRISEENSEGFLRVIKLVMLIHSKPDRWAASAAALINAADRNSFYILKMLTAIMRHFMEDVNTAVDRDELKRLIALIQTKHNLKKDTPGSRAVNRVLGRLEERDFFVQKNDTSDG
jgi:SIR2-like domain